MFKFDKIFPVIKIVIFIVIFIKFSALAGNDLEISCLNLS